jgi:class 3 adenylate cyclase
MDRHYKTLVVTDLVDSTAIVDSLGDLPSSAIFERVELVTRARLADLGGLEIDKTDGFLLLFDRPVDAVIFALGLHADLADLSAEFGLALKVRCGIHFGEVLLRRNAPEAVERGAKPIEVEGIAKPITARIMALGRGGQILCSRAAWDLAERSKTEAPELRGTGWTLHGSYRLKGIREPMQLAEISAVGQTPAAPTQPTPKTRPTLSWPSTIALLATATACFLGVFDLPDSLTRQPLINLIRGPMTIENTVLMGISDQSDFRILREQHPAAIERLVDAGASAVVFDIAMTAATDMDEAIAQAILAAKAKGVSVILPVHINDVDGLVVADPPQTKALREAAELGQVAFQYDLFLGTIRRATIRRRTADGDTVWASAVLALQAHLGGRRPIRIEGNVLLVGGTRNPIWADQAWLQPFGDVPVIDYFDPQVSPDVVAGKVVVIGAYGGTQDVKRTLMGPRYGPELHAALIETLIRQQALRVVPNPVNAMFTLLVGLFTSLMGWVIPQRWRLLALWVPVAMFAVAIALAWGGVMLAIWAPALAAVFGFRSVRLQSDAHPRTR